MDTLSDSKSLKWTGFYKLGAISAVIIVLIYLIELVVMVFFGLPPTNAEGWFTLLLRNRWVGLIQTFALDAIAVTFHAPLYLAIFFYFKQAKKFSATLILAMVFALIGIAVYLASNVTFSMLYLSDQFRLAATQTQKVQILTSAQTLMAIYNGTGPFVAYFLYAVAGILVSIAMLRSRMFASWIAIAGILGNALELGLPPSIDPPFFLQIDPILIGIGGVILIIWYIAIAIKFFGVSTEL